MAYIPDKGDIIWLDFDPSSGSEIRKRRPALIITRKIFNERVGFAIVAPITSTVRNIALEVLLPKSKKLKTQGSILTYQMRALDIIERSAEFIERAPQDVIDKVTKMATVIVS